MSETVHYIGKLKPTNKTIEEYLGNIELEEWHDDIRDYFEDKFCTKAVEYKGFIYEIEKHEIDSDDDIFMASLNRDSSINFEVKYYNGGCSFNEAINNSLSNTTGE